MECGTSLAAMMVGSTDHWWQETVALATQVRCTALSHACLLCQTESIRLHSEPGILQGQSIGQGPARPHRDEHP